MRQKEKSYWESQGQANRCFVRTAKSGGWREHFTSELESKFWAAAGATMLRLGILAN